MNDLLRKDNKGVSDVIGYVLLIALALGISGAVYSFLKFYVPKDVPQCPSDVNLIISNISCSAGKISITLSNRGLFSVDGAYLKIGAAGEQAKDTLNCPSASASSCKLYFAQYDPKVYSGGLKPGERWSSDYSYALLGDKELEIEPLVFVGGSNYTQAICTNSIVTQTVTCT
jgi:hypothetical protein